MRRKFKSLKKKKVDLDKLKKEKLKEEGNLDYQWSELKKGNY